MRKTTGISRRSFLLACGPILGRAEESYAVIAGTVFTESGRAFPQVKVELEPAKPGKKFKAQSAISNQRGEYAFRVPAAAMEYQLSVKIQGYLPATKSVKISGEERVEENFLLDRASRKD